MNSTLHTKLSQHWTSVQEELIPLLDAEIVPLSTPLLTVVRAIEWVGIESFITRLPCGMGRPLEDRATLARAFIAKMILRLPTAIALIERLQMDRALQRICGFDPRKALPSESTFSRAFDELAKGEVAQRCHAAFIQFHLGDQLICHITRDATAIETRERPASRTPRKETSIDLTAVPGQKKRSILETAVAVETTATPATEKTTTAKPKRGRPKKGEVRPEPGMSRIEKQRSQSLAQMIKDLPTQCDRGSKCNAQGYKNSWNGYKLHFDVADGGHSYFSHLNQRLGA